MKRLVQTRTVRDIKEQEVFFCDLPVMVDLHEDINGQFSLVAREHS